MCNLESHPTKAAKELGDLSRFAPILCHGLLITSAGSDLANYSWITTWFKLSEYFTQINTRKDPKTQGLGPPFQEHEEERLLGDASGRKGDQRGSRNRTKTDKRRGRKEKEAGTETSLELTLGPKLRLQRRRGRRKGNLDSEARSYAFRREHPSCFLAVLGASTRVLDHG